MILLTEAIERYGVVASDHGVYVSRRRRPQAAANVLAELETRLAPLKLPAELHALWANWAPRTFGSLFFDGVYEPREAERIYRRDVANGYPRIMMPVACIEKAGVWVELAGADHPGGRIYHTFYEDGRLQLWCVDLSSLIHLLAETIERDGVKDSASTRPWIDVAVFDDVRLERTSELLAMPDEWQVPVAQSDQWPAHWRKVQNPGESDVLDLRRDATHTVAEFVDAHSRGRVTGILHGRVSGVVTGGPVDGLIITFADDTGSIQLYASTEIREALERCGMEARLEVEVLGEPNAGPKNELKTWMLRRNLEELSIGHLRLLSQMRRLDVSAAVLNLRPLDR